MLKMVFYLRAPKWRRLAKTMELSKGETICEHSATLQHRHFGI